MKHVLTINDISCIGRCSVTVALPVISAAGIECSPLPTALLSTHTGGFPGFFFRDLTDAVPAIAAHWKSLGITFDMIYSGYLGSKEQIDTVLDIADSFGKPPLFVDPVMGDAGRLYTNFDLSFVERMRELCKRADVITPNLTEAAYLLGESYRESYDEKYVRTTLEKLTALGARSCVISGISLAPGEVGAASLDSASGEYRYCPGECVPGFYHGAGDVFASVLCAAFTLGVGASDAIAEAVDFTVKCIRRTAEDKDDTRYGLHFEPYLAELRERIGKYTRDR